jgi:hypothetical protein
LYVPRAQLEIAGLQLEDRKAAGQRLPLHAGRHLFRQVAQNGQQLVEGGEVAFEGRLGRDALGSPLRNDRAVVLAACEAREADTDRPVAGRELMLVGSLQVADPRQPIAR